MDVAWATLKTLILKSSSKIFIVGRGVRGEVVPGSGGARGLADLFRPLWIVLFTAWELDSEKKLGFYDVWIELFIT